MRIVSGKFKGRRFFPPSNITARPTTDFAKEALFNVLNNRLDFEDLLVLDLFAGVGSISLEFASRGSASVTAVEMSRTQANFIRKISKEMEFDCISLIQADAFRFLKTCKTKYDMIFADPPYDLPTATTLPDIIFEKELLKEDGILVMEHSPTTSFSLHPRFTEVRNYGKVHFSFFE